jgi:hypothetical protein
MFRAGGPWATGFDGNVDAFAIGVNGSITVYDFETVDAVASGVVIINEFRTQGTTSNDEFIELYNTTSAPVNLTNFRVEVEGGAAFTIPSGSIPARGHYLFANTDGYSLSTYAAPDFPYSGSDQPANAGIRLLNASSMPIDAVGFAASSSGFKEGTGLAPVAALGQYSHVRSQVTSGLPQDSANNSADFLLVATDPTALGSGSKLGAPGPQSTTSHIQYNPATELVLRLIDQTVSSTSSPNRNVVRTAYNDVHTPSSPNGLAPGSNPYPGGTLSVQRRVINNTGQTVTMLRFRVNDITTGPTVAGPIADIRLITSNVITTQPAPAGRGPSSVPAGVVLRGMTLEQPPTQLMGGGYNSSVTVDLSTTPNGALLPGEWVDVQFLLGIAQGGSFRFFIVAEAVKQ